jgi:hypothetical protein
MKTLRTGIIIPAAATNKNVNTENREGDDA